MLTTLEKAKALKEFRSLRVALTSGALKTLEKAKSLKRFRELRVLLSGEGVPVEQPKDYTPLLNSIINGDLNTFDDKAKLTELVGAAQESGGDDMPDDKKGLFIEAVEAAGIQYLEGLGYEPVN